MAPLHLVQAGGRENGLGRVASPTNDDSDRSKTKLSLSTRCPPPILTKTTRPQAIRYASLGIPLQLSTPSPDRMKQNLHIGAGAHVAIRGLFPGRFIVGGYKCEPWFVAPGLHMRLEPGRTSLPIYPQCRDIRRLDQRHRGNDKRSVRISQAVAKAIGMRSISWGRTMLLLASAPYIPGWQDLRGAGLAERPLNAPSRVGSPVQPSHRSHLNQRRATRTPGLNIVARDSL